jgi:protein-tyrosine-phosphatase
MRSKITGRNILFLSQDNDCLSFMAETIAKRLLPPKTQVFSAGLNGGQIEPKAVQALREIGNKRHNSGSKKSRCHTDQRH